MIGFVQAVIDGLLVGGVYAVISIGLTLVFGVLGIVNFAQAEFLMLGMYIAYFVWAALGLDPLAGAFVAFAVVFALGYGLQRTVIQRVMTAPPVAQVFLTVGLLIVMENGALLGFGSQIRSVTTAYQAASLQFGPFFVSLPYLYAFLMSIVAGTALWWLLHRSWLGLAIRATAADPMAGRLVGIDIERTMALAFGLGVGLTALGGAVVLPYLSVSPTAGSQFVVLMFTVAVVGGLGSIPGAVVGGLVVGVVTSVSALLFPIQLQNLVLFLVFIAILALRPDGLWGRSR